MPPWAAHHSAASHPIPYLPVINQLLGHYTVSGRCRRGRPLGPAKPKRFRRQHALGWRLLVLAEERKGWQTKLARQGAQIKLGPGEKGYQKGIQRAPACGGLRGGPAPQHKGGGRREGPAKGGGRWYALRTGVLGPQSLMRGAGRREGRAGAAKLAGVIGE